MNPMLWEMRRKDPKTMPHLWVLSRLPRDSVVSDSRTWFAKHFRKDYLPGPCDTAGGEETVAQVVWVLAQGQVASAVEP